MDNKITKRRLQNFLSYNWIWIIAIVVVGIIVWEIIFTMTRVTLTTGQDFLFFYDETIDASMASQTYTLFENKNKEGRSVFSYDVFKISHEGLEEDYNVLRERLSIQEGDVIITDCSQPADDAENKSVRAFSIIDNFLTYDYQTLLEDAEDYLADLLKDEFLDQYGKPLVDVADYNNLDGAKIETLFRERMKGDNRYRTESQKAEGIELEKERIEDLCYEVKKFRHLLSQGDEYFLKYRRYDQIYDSADEKTKEYFDADEYRQKGERKYGLKVEALGGGIDKDASSKYFKKAGADTAKDVVILVFDLQEYQPHLQFETIAFINAIVDGCSELYEGI